MGDFYFLFGVVHFCISIGPVLFVALLIIKRMLFRNILERKENSLDVRNLEIFHTVVLFLTFFVAIIEIAALIGGIYLFYFDYNF